MTAKSNVLVHHQALSVNLFYILIFAYFFVLAADLLHFRVYLFRFTIAHCIGAACFFSFFAQYRHFVLDRRWIPPFLWILCSICMSVFFSVDKIKACGYIFYYLFDFFCFFLLPFNFIYFLNSEKLIRCYQISFICVGCYAVMQLVFSFFGLVDPFLTQMMGRLARPHAFSHEASFYALYATPFVMWGNTLYILNAEVSWKKVMGLNMLLLISFTTSAVVAYSFFLFFLWIFRNQFREGWIVRVRRLMSMLMLVFLAGLVFCLPLIKAFVLKIFLLGGLDHPSFFERWDRLKHSLSVFFSHPLFGVGLGGIDAYGFRQFLQEQGKEGMAAAYSGLQLYLFEPSNVFTEILGSLGLFGLGGFILLAWVGISIIKETFKFKSNEFLALSLGLLVVLCVLQINQGIFRSYIWVHAGMTFGYAYKLRKVYESASSLENVGR